MNALIRPALIVAVAFLLGLCLFGLHFAWDPADLRELIQAGFRREQFEQFERSQFRHFEAKEQVMRDVIAQRCSLSEALARLQELDGEWLQEVGRNWPDFTSGMAWARRKEWSDADYYYRAISSLAAELLSDRPQEAASVLRRLEKDYQPLRACRQTFSSAPMERSGPSHSTWRRALIHSTPTPRTTLTACGPKN